MRYERLRPILVLFHINQLFLWQQLDLVCFAGDDAILLVQALNIAGKNRRAIFQIQNIVRHAVKVLCDMGR